MNVSVPPPGSQVYVEISSLSAQISSSNNIEDVHICGSCKHNFSDLDLFVEHKRAGCSAPTQKIPTPGAPYSQSSLEYVTTSTANANEDNPLGTQYLQVILDDEQLSVQGNQAQNQQLSSTIQCPSDTDQQILRARLLAVAEQDSSVTNNTNFQNSNDLHSLVLNEQQQSVARQREFQIDEEDVATLLANQLASEVVDSVNESSLSSKTGLINIHHELVPKSQNHFALEPMNLPVEAKDIVLKVDGSKRCHAKEKGASKSNNSNSMTAGNLRWTSGNKCIGNKTNILAPTNSSESGILNTTTSISGVKCVSQVTKSENTIVDSLSGKKKHKCTQESCDFTTWYQKDLIRHERKHTGERPFQCYSCHRNFSRLDKLHMHERIHSGDKRFKCEICDYATHDGGSLRKHMRIHNDERPYKCQICPYRSRDSSQLTVHLRTHTGDNPFVCTYENCTSAFKTSSDLKRHSRTHTGEKPFSCPYCQYKCAIKSNLRVHIRLTHSDGKAISCSLCNYVASTKREVKDHEKSHSEGVLFKCGICSYTCMNASEMKSHYKIHSQDKSVSCKFCNFTCRIPGTLKRHVKKKHPETFRKKHRATGKDFVDTSKPQLSVRSGNSRGTAHLKPFCVKSYKCTYCDAAFVREDSWRSHMRQHKNSVKNSSTIPMAVIAMGSESKETNNDTITGPDNTMSLEIHTDQQRRRKEGEKDNLISADFLILNNNDDPLKETAQFVVPCRPDEIANMTTNSGIETSFVQFSVGGKNEKGQVPVVHQLSQDVLESENLQSQPILLYVQNAPVLPSGLDSSLRNAEIVASINQSAPILVTGRCGQLLSVPLDQGSSLVEQFTSPVPQGMQYIVSAPFDGVVGGNTAYIQPLETNDNSGNSVSVVSFQVDKGSVLTPQEGNN